jgi:hypothetical protein
MRARSGLKHEGVIVRDDREGEAASEERTLRNVRNIQKIHGMKFVSAKNVAEWFDILCKLLNIFVYR